MFLDASARMLGRPLANQPPRGSGVQPSGEQSAREVERGTLALVLSMEVRRLVLLVELRLV